MKLKIGSLILLCQNLVVSASDRSLSSCSPYDDTTMVKISRLEYDRIHDLIKQLAALTKTHCGVSVPLSDQLGAVLLNLSSTKALAATNLPVIKFPEDL